MSKSLIRNLGIVLLLFIVGIFLNTYRVSHEKEAKQLDGKRQEMMKVINQAAQKRQAYQANYGTIAQPVASADLDQVQNMLISKMKASGLDVVSLIKVAAPSAAPTGAQAGNKPGPKSSGVIYEATISGSWDASMKYLNGLKNDSVLMQIQSIRMEASTIGTNVKTTFKYKIFIES